MARVVIAAALVLVASTADAYAGDFRGGSIRWRVPDPMGAPLTVEFTVTTLWNEPAMQPRETVLAFGDGSEGPPTVGSVLSTPSTLLGQAYVVTRYSAAHTYPGPGLYVATVDGCCRVTTLTVPQADGAFRLVTRVDAGAIAGPDALVVRPQIAGPLGGTLPIPAAAPTLAGLTGCRFATTSESALSPPFSLDADAVYHPDGTCGLSWQWPSPIGRGDEFTVSLVVSTERASASVDFVLEGTGGMSVPVCPPREVEVVPGDVVTIDLSEASANSASLSAAPAGAMLSQVDVSSWQLTWTPPGDALGASSLAVVTLSTPTGESCDLGVAYVVSEFISIDECALGTDDCLTGSCVDRPIGFECCEPGEIASEGSCVPWPPPCPCPEGHYCDWRYPTPLCIPFPEEDSGSGCQSSDASLATGLVLLMLALAQSRHPRRTRKR
jgi:hypothetical protein